jgi:glycosyltransferase 2 family protein
MLRRLVTSRWAKLALLAVALGFCAYGLYAQQAEVAAALHQLVWGSVVGAAAAAIVGLGCLMLAWRTVVSDLGSHLALRPATRVMFISQLGKYVPGAVWVTAAQVELGREHLVPRQRSATASILAMLITLATGLLVAAATLPLSSASAVRHYWWALALAPPALVALYPPLTNYVLNRLLRLARRPPLERQLSMAGMAKAVAWSLLGWGFFSVHSWLLVADLTDKGVSVLPIAAGAYALAWSVGFVLIPFPGGVGPRELAFIAALAPVMPRGSAIVVAVVSRLVLTVADLAWAALAFALGRGMRATPASSPTEAGAPAEAGPETTPRPAAPVQNTVPR